MFDKEFDSYVCEGDSITCTVAGLDCRATLYRDDNADRPDENDCGFWPSLDPTKAGYIGPKSRHALARATAKAQAIMDAWQKDEWHYFGVAITVSKNGVELTNEFANALWGIEGNYPGHRKGRNPNKYFRQVANELLPEAIAEAKAKLELLCECDEVAA